ncbi:hypothetical protein AK830_g877 [Neonectria ditissima]|uniref:2EXR domain-containing protein n=1 Tax=Neonectria ditissima TaxID=78410 RepID=A0A0P7BV99_9HYPO|nr:hypothetical protein AK830_g877 [Neonectria ditissima]
MDYEFAVDGGMGGELKRQYVSDEEVDACSISTIDSAIKFDIPPDCRDFSPFARLPAEIRHQIWECTLATPGMHFLKIENEDVGNWVNAGSPLHDHSDSSSDDDKETDGLTLEVQRETRPALTHRANLVPLYPSPEADISYYTTLNQEITKLTVTCNESAAVVKHLMARPTTLTLSGGRMISLDIASDIIYLEYVPPSIFEDGCYFTKALQCAGLERIRKVAVRYCHKWSKRPSPTRCSVCGQIHSTAEGAEYPKHLYQFIAQYLPNLEQLYFVDYFILRKSNTSEPRSGFGVGVATGAPEKTKAPLERFEGGNRTYYEVDGRDWVVKSKVFETMSWIQDRFVKYAKTSKLSSHKSPEKVKFGVLACEWTLARRLDMKKAPTTPIKKGRNKRTICEEHNTWRSRRSPHRSPAPVMESPPAGVPGNFPFVFGVEGSNDFSFTFAVPR